MSITLSRAVLHELVTGEKEDVSWWLRTEMDSLVEPLVESLFDKLITKLTSALDRNPFVNTVNDSGDCAQGRWNKLQSSNALGDVLNRCGHNQTNEQVNHNTDDDDDTASVECVQPEQCNEVTNEPITKSALSSTSEEPAQHCMVQVESTEQQINSLCVQINNESQITHNNSDLTLSLGQMHHHLPQFHYNSRSLITQYWNELIDASEDLPNRDDDIQPNEQVNDNIGDDDIASEDSSCCLIIDQSEESNEANIELITKNQSLPSLSSSTTSNKRSNQNCDSANNEDDCYERETAISLEPKGNQVHQQVTFNCQPSTSTEISLRTNVLVRPQSEITERPVKKPRLDVSQVCQSQITGSCSMIESSTQTEEDLQMNAFKPAHVVTIAMKCLSTCVDMFDTKVDLERHMWHRHFTRPYRCLFKKCHNSFCDEHSGLVEHLQRCHPNITEWQCGKCCDKFASHVDLSCHDILYHQLGLFQCAFPGCEFTGECRGIVLKHYNQQKFKVNHFDVLSFKVQRLPQDLRTIDKTTN